MAEEVAAEGVESAVTRLMQEYLTLGRREEEEKEEKADD